MPAWNNPNLIILELAVDALGSLADEMVFIGGCATGLLITDTAAPIIRATKDVDVITEVASLVDYHRLSEQLRGLGFAEDQSEDAMQVKLPSGKSISLVTAPYFLITKLAAFEGRGNGDYLMSHDIEDIIALLDGRPAVLEDVLNADEVVKNAIKEQFSMFSGDERFLEAIPGHLPGDEASQARLPLIIERVDALAKLVE